jgi:transcription elongation factor GreB
MSKAFTKDDASDDPLIVPPRAPLPAGVPNYVTARGLRLLHAERAELEAERTRINDVPGDDDAQRRARAILRARLSALAARIASAIVVDPREQPRDEVRFGATVALRTLEGERAGEERRLTIVGVDEADPAHGRVAMTSPIARAVLGCRQGDTAELRTERGEQRMEIVTIEYDAE